MIAAPPHPNETGRLAALQRYGILDTPPEQAFDDLTALAAQICEAPVAMISLVDARRQWFKSIVGVDATETPREVAFCAHAILERHGLLIVPDARLDPRFVDNPLVVGGPHVVSYAAAVVYSSDGFPVGTLCVVDHVPRDYTPGQVTALQRLASQVTSQLSLRETASRLQADILRRIGVERRLAASERLYRQLVDNAQGLICVHDMAGRLRTVNESAVQMLDYPHDEMVGRNLRTFVPAAHQEAFDRYLAHMHRLPHYSGFLTLVRRDGSRIALAYRNFRFESADGQYVVGHGIEIGDRRSPAAGDDEPAPCQASCR